MDRHGTRDRNLALLAAAALSALLGVAAFVPALRNEFVWDDNPFIARNPAVLQPGPWYRFWRLPFWPRMFGSDKLYRPLTTWSYRVNFLLSGQPAPDPYSFHLVNIVLHGLTSAGVAVLAWRLTRKPWVAWLAGALFATHPLHTEAVATGYGRSELMAGFFAVWLLMRYVRKRPDVDEAPAPPPADGPPAAPAAPAAGALGYADASAAPGRRRRTTDEPAWFHLFNTLLLLAAVMSKEHAVFVWPVLLVYDLWRYQHTPPRIRRPLRAWLARSVAPAHVGFMLALSLFFDLRFWLFKWNIRLDPERVSFRQSPLAHATLIEHLLSPFRFLWLSLKLCLWPPSLCPIWSIPALPLPRGLDPDVIAGMALTVGLLVLGLLTWRRSKLGLTIFGLLVLLALPLQAIPMAHWIYAERWLYLPSALAAVLVAVGLNRLGPVGRTAGLAAAIILLPATWQYTAKFHDIRTMIEEVVTRQPNSYNGWQQKAILHLEFKEYQDAIQASKEILERFSYLSKEPPSEPYAIMLKSYLALGNGREALAALNMYEWLRREIPEPSLLVEREQAEALIAREQAASRPATGSAPS